jgi:hypothetical protein
MMRDELWDFKAKTLFSRSIPEGENIHEKCQALKELLNLEKQEWGYSKSHSITVREMKYLKSCSENI